MTSMTDKLDEIDHIVVIMLENRSFDHMLGFLYKDQNNRSPLDHPFEGLTGNERNIDSQGQPIQVFPIPNNEYAYYWPGTDPGEGYSNTNSQLFGDYKTPSANTPASNQGFVTDFAYTLNTHRKNNASSEANWYIAEGTQPKNIMGMYTPELLPVLSTLARSYAVCDHWFCSVPTETLPNRAFVQMATSLGRLNDHDKVYDATSIYNLLEHAQVPWAIYGYDSEPILTRQSLAALPPQPQYGKFGDFAAFKQAANSNQLASYTFLAPEWGVNGNSQHPNYDVAKGEQLLLEIYQTLKNAPVWEKTLLIITYDEHGGCYDHVAPPENAAQPANCPDNLGFNFQRFGVRVPTVLVSPLIEAGTVFRTQSSTPLDHTSILSTVEKRFNLPSLTARDAAAPHVGDVLTLASVRSDDPMAHVIAPSSSAKPPAENGKAEMGPDHLQMAEAHLAGQLPIDKDYHSRYDTHFNTEAEAKEYTHAHYYGYYYNDRYRNR
ncbi:alkaline phosphatase family protein [Shewanella surugensis]|uniref:Phosphoesterase n=1 Tax=Shewanella surugensis TaxID=212020 RepID=A0ABT0L8S6_9GAMM|nr:alkaline phosphatase family protein [Shewanella surugensis]MCL1124103.1 hypothetical protein [Shewanella surugensis]